MRGKTKEETKLSGRTSKRSSAYETAKRVGYAESLLVNGIRHNAAVVHLTEKFQVCERQAERYVAAVYKLWREQDDEDRRLKMVRAIARRQEVFFQSLKKNDYASANKALDALERLEGVAPGLLMKHHHTADVNQNVEPSPAFLDLLREVMSDSDRRHALALKLAPLRESEIPEDATCKTMTPPQSN